MKRASPGFTLLEVLAAVALLGIVYTVLAGSAVQGLRAEGISKRRLAASLLADERLAEIESQINVGIPLEMGTQESEQDAFRIVIEVRDFELPEEWAEIAAADAGQGPSIFTSANPRAPMLVRTIDLTVGWLEGADEHRVVRTTYAYDALAAAALLGGVGTPNAPEAPAPEERDLDER